MRISFKPGDDHAYIDGVAVVGGFKDLDMAGMASVDFDFPSRTGIIKWLPVDDTERVRESLEESGRKVNRYVQKKLGTQTTPPDTQLNYDTFYAIVSRDLNAWQALSAEINNRLEAERHASEAAAVMDEAEAANAAFDAQPAPVAEVSLSEAPAGESVDDMMKRIRAAHAAQAKKNAEENKKKRGPF